jgi:hypothetical protein
MKASGAALAVTEAMATRATSLENWVKCIVD